MSKQRKKNRKQPNKTKRNETKCKKNEKKPKKIFENKTERKNGKCPTRITSKPILIRLMMMMMVGCKLWGAAWAHTHTMCTRATTWNGNENYSAKMYVSLCVCVCLTHCPKPQWHSSHAQYGTKSVPTAMASFCSVAVFQHTEWSFIMVCLALSSTYFCVSILLLSLSPSPHANRAGPPRCTRENESWTA